MLRMPASSSGVPPKPQAYRLWPSNSSQDICASPPSWPKEWNKSQLCRSSIGYLGECPSSCSSLSGETLAFLKCQMRLIEALDSLRADYVEVTPQKGDTAYLYHWRELLRASDVNDLCPYVIIFHPCLVPGSEFVHLPTDKEERRLLVFKLERFKNKRGHARHERPPPEPQVGGRSPTTQPAALQSTASSSSTSTPINIAQKMCFCTDSLDTPTATARRPTPSFSSSSLPPEAADLHCSDHSLPPLGNRSSDSSSLISTIIIPPTTTTTSTITTTTTATTTTHASSSSSTTTGAHRETWSVAPACVLGSADRVARFSGDDAHPLLRLAAVSLPEPSTLIAAERHVPLRTDVEQQGTPDPYRPTARSAQLGRWWSGRDSEEQWAAALLLAIEAKAQEHQQRCATKRLENSNDDDEDDNDDGSGEIKKYLLSGPDTRTAQPTNIVLPDSSSNAAWRKNGQGDAQGSPREDSNSVSSQDSDEDVFLRNGGSGGAGGVGFAAQDESCWAGREPFGCSTTPCNRTRHDDNISTTTMTPISSYSRRDSDHHYPSFLYRGPTKRKPLLSSAEDNFWPSPFGLLEKLASSGSSCSSSTTSGIANNTASPRTGGPSSFQDRQASSDAFGSWIASCAMEEALQFSDSVLLAASSSPLESPLKKRRPYNTRTVRRPTSKAREATALNLHTSSSHAALASNANGRQTSSDVAAAGTAISTTTTTFLTKVGGVADKSAES